MKIELDIPDGLLEEAGLTEFDVKMIIGTALIDKVSSRGKTAEILGIEHMEFAENISGYGKPDSDYWEKHYVPDYDNRSDNYCRSEHHKRDSDFWKNFDGNPRFALGAGESSSVILAVEEDSIFLSDDLTVREFADVFGIKIKGTIGIMKDALKKGLVDIGEAEDTLRAMKQKGWWIPDELLDREIMEMKKDGRG